MTRSATFILCVLLALQGAAASAADPAVRPEGGAPGRAYRPMPYQNLVLNWNEAMLAAIRAHPPRPTVTARNLHIFHSAIYDAWAAYDARAAGTRFGTALRRPAADRTEANISAAVSHAAHRVASALYPASREIFDSLHRRLAHRSGRDEDDPDGPARIGAVVADAVLAFWAEDGSNWREDFRDPTGYRPVNGLAAVPGAPGYDPNRWQPLKVPNGTARDGFGNPVATSDPGSYMAQAFLTPHWGGVRPFALPAGDAVRPAGPPVHGDPRPYVDARGRRSTGHDAWVEQYAEVLALHGTLDDTPLGALRRCVAEFWADGPRSETPPGHWNQIAHGIALREGYGTGETARLFLALSGALHDAAIAAWDAKRAYDSARPITAIRHHWRDATVVSWVGPHRGVGELPGRDWLPYQDPTFLTPAFPEYVSGHSVFSMAAAVTIAGFTGSERFHDPIHPTTIVLDLDDEPGPDILGRFVARDLAFDDHAGPPMVLVWPTLFDAAREAGASRLYGGIHIQDANLRGQQMGRIIGELALKRARALFAGTAPIEQPDTPPGHGGADARKALRTP